MLIFFIMLQMSCVWKIITIIIWVNFTWVFIIYLFISKTIWGHRYHRNFFYICARKFRYKRKFIFLPVLKSLKSLSLYEKALSSPTCSCVIVLSTSQSICFFFLQEVFFFFILSWLVKLFYGRKNNFYVLFFFCRELGWTLRFFLRAKDRVIKASRCHSRWQKWRQPLKFLACLLSPTLPSCCSFLTLYL